GHTAVIQLLLDNNANIETKDKDGDTPLGIAAYYGQTAAIQLLLDYNADINAKSNDNVGRTPLSYAVEKGGKSIVKALLDSGKVDVNRKDKKGRTPLS
ncbi:hypothetical protein CI102_13947, partial [Trichoderma harzianum]